MRSDDVVEDRLAWMIFHHRHVLVRGCMKDDLRRVTRKRLFYRNNVLDIGENRRPLEIRND